ncbi:MAG: hypothetical protein AB7S38_17555 [Vulcanimicrobiota bacterium]
MGNGTRRGIALITALLFATVLMIMLVAIVAGATGGNFTTRGHTDRLAALGAAEAGVAHALAELEANRAWVGGFNSTTLLGGRGSYTLIFNTNADTQSVGKHESVNNLAGLAVVNGPRGDGTVPPGVADLVVVARVGPVERVVEVLVRRGGGPEVDVALLNSGRVHMRGDVRVEGIGALDDPTPEPAGIHSNFAGSDPDLIKWTQDPGTTATIAGTVSAVAASGISLTGATLGGSPPTQNNASAKPFPTVDIEAEILAKQTATPATVPAVGGATLGSGTPEDFYYDGDLLVNGDLVLNGATLYVNGKVTVNGSITGDGGLYVNGADPDEPATVFRGDATIVTNNDRKVSIFSKGSVELTGFDGDQYIQDLATAQGNPQLSLWWDQAKTALDALDTDMQNYGVADFGTTVRDRRVDIQRTLAPFNTGQPGFGGSDEAVLEKIATVVNAAGSGPTEQFMVKRLTYVSDLFKGGGSHLGGDLNVLNNFNPDIPSTHAGLLDSVGDQYTTHAHLWGQVLSIHQQIGFGRLGSSNFQGVIYTNGYFYADNQVNIVGAVIANDDGSQQPVDINGQTVAPGDVLLNSGTSITYNKAYFDDTSQAATGPMTVTTWVAR